MTWPVKGRDCGPKITVQIPCDDCLGDFDWVRNTGWPGPRPRRCADCKLTRERAVSRDWQRANAERYRAAKNKYAKKANIQRYGISVAEYEQMVRDQGGRCAICAGDKPKTPRGSDRWAIDHDRSCCNKMGSCGKCIRGLLCTPCNSGLGHFRDNPDFLRGAIEYLARANA